MSETHAPIDTPISDDLDTFTDDFFGRKSSEVKSEDKTTPDVEQDDDDKVEESAKAQDDLDEQEAKEEIPETPKRKTVQDRIDEVVRQREELKRESAAEIARLRQEFEDYKKSAIPAKQASSEDAEPAPDALNDHGDPIYALGEFDPQYIRDLTRFTLKQERAKVEVETAESQRQSAIQQEQQVLQTQWNGKVTEATTEYPDFVEKGQALLNNFNDLPQEYAGYLSSVLMSMEKGPDVLYYLSNHPDEAKAIVNSGAQKATLALGRIESRFLQSEKEAPKPKITKAPEPPQERARGTNGAFVSVAPDTDNLDDFEQAFFAKKK